ncbi:MAG TPA: tyrosine-type recombinase/integrase [Leptolyngbyaceae cyanobacterium]
MAKSNRNGQALVLTPEQLMQLWAELDQPYRLVTQIAYFTAARCGEVVSLERQDLRGDEIVYRASKTKTRTTRTAQVSPQLTQYLAEVSLPSKGYLFPSGSGSGHLTVRAVDKWVRRSAELIGLDGVSTHSFRRSQATHLHLGGVPLRAIQRITGHATLAALERYLDIGSAEAFENQQVVMAKLFGVA